VQGAKEMIILKANEGKVSHKQTSP